MTCQKTLWAWELTRGDESVEGRTEATDPRDALSRMLTSSLPDGRLLGEAHRIPIEALHEAPGNGDSHLTINGDDFCITVRRYAKVTPYNPDDYQRNPGKYALFRTARIAKPISSSLHLALGSVVRIRFHHVIPNCIRGTQEMPVYYVWPANAKDTADNASLLYACALGDFVL